MVTVHTDSIVHTLFYGPNTCQNSTIIMQLFFRTFNDDKTSH